MKPTGRMWAGGVWRERFRGCKAGFWEVRDGWRLRGVGDEGRGRLGAEMSPRGGGAGRCGMVEVGVSQGTPGGLY